MTSDELHAIWREADRAAIEARRAYEAALRAEHPVQPGDLLTATDGREALVMALEIYYGNARPVAIIRKKDGTFGSARATMWLDKWANARVTRPAPAPESRP